MSLDFDAVLLAAGRSRRMGADKALLPSGHGDERLWERQWRLLAEAGATRRWLSARADQAWPPAEIAAWVVRDDNPERGPLAGVVAAWKQSEASHLIVLAVDLPRLPAAWFRRLWLKCRDGVGVAGCHPDGTFEPLAGIYPRVWLAAWEDALAAGNGSLQRLLDDARRRNALEVEPITPRESAWFHNVNTPADWGRVEI